MVSLAALLGGIDGRALVGLFTVSAAVAVLGCALAMAISVEVVKTDEVIMAVVALVTCWLLSLPLWGGMARAYGLPAPPEWFYATNPFVLVYAPYTWPGHFGLLEVALFAAGSLAVSAGLLAATIARLRRFVLPAEVGRRRWKFRVPAPGLATLRAGLARFRAWREERLPGPSLDGNPVLWREWHRSRPSRMTQILWGLYWLGAIVATAIGIYEVLAYGIDNVTGGFMLTTALVVQSVLGLMLLSVQAPTALGEERVRGSLDVLMAAPISTRAILWGKWLGTYRVALGMAVLPGVAATVIAAVSPGVPPRFRAAASPIPVVPISLVDRVLAPVLVVAELLSWGAAFTSLGLLLATWTPRIGRAVGISLAVFLLLSIGWLFLCGAVILPALRVWLYARYKHRWGRPDLDRFGPDGLQPHGRAHRDHPDAGHRLRRPLAILDHHGRLVPAGLGVRRGDVLGGAAVVRPSPRPDARDQPGRRRPRPSRLALSRSASGARMSDR